MAKKSIIARNKRRIRTVKRFETKRETLKEAIRVAAYEGNYDELMTLTQKLQAMPRNASRCRVRNRCALSGRGKGYYRKFGLARNMLRLFAMQGDIPGLVKASW